MSIHFEAPEAGLSTVSSLGQDHCLLGCFVLTMTHCLLEARDRDAFWLTVQRIRIIVVAKAWWEPGPLAAVETGWLP